MGLLYMIIVMIQITIVLFYLIIQFFSFKSMAYTNNWFPIASISGSDFSNPRQIRVLGKDYVLWKKNDQIVFQDDVCPHRCAPLSEGYIDRKTNNLRCAYHGWEFNEEGHCETIPQMRNDNISKKMGCLKNYPTSEHGNIIWAYLGNEPYREMPKTTYNLTENCPMFVRDIPYGLYIFLENFFDPSHIPFAHHKLQSMRNKGCPIDIQLLSSIDDKEKLSIYFRNEDGEHEGMITNFEMPCHYSISPPKNITKIPMFVEQHMFLVPIQEDKTRIFISFEVNEEHKASKIYKYLPTWIRHLLYNRFLDSDTYLLYKQENYLRQFDESYHNVKKYYMPASSDKSVMFYRKWIKNALPEIPYFIKRREMRDLSREEVFDRYEQHTKNCKDCKTALMNINKTKKYGTIIFLLGFFYLQNPLLLLLASMNYALFENMRKMFYYQDYVHNTID